MTEKQLLHWERKKCSGLAPNEMMYQKLERLFRLKRERIADGMPPKWKSRAEYKKAWRAKQKARKEAADGREKEGREKRQETLLRSHDNGSQNQNA